jgi:aspartyl aminopeptidase
MRAYADTELVVAQIVVRGASAFAMLGGAAGELIFSARLDNLAMCRAAFAAMPKLVARLEALNTELGDIEYVIGVTKNARLLNLARRFASLRVASLRA